MIGETVSGDTGITVRRLDGLLVDFAVREDAFVVIRGLRAVSDFEFEFQMALMNRRLEPRLETIFLTPKEDYTFLSSRIVKRSCAPRRRCHAVRAPVGRGSIEGESFRLVVSVIAGKVKRASPDTGPGRRLLSPLFAPFLAMFVWFWVAAHWFPLREGRDAMTYFLCFRDMFQIEPEFPLV